MEISIIVIGRNEGFKLLKCFTSLEKLKSLRKIDIEFETIYLDSDSTDNSITVAYENKIDYVIGISGEINAAIARNVGARYAKYEWLLFLDGDMELNERFFLDDEIESYFEKYDFFSGQFINHYYNSDWEKISEEDFIPNPKIEQQYTPGGLFFVRNRVWKELNGMKDYYRRSQDFDFGLRCFKKGYQFIRLNQMLAVHHMISYLNKSRTLDFFKKGYYLYSRSLLYREHLLLNFNKSCLKILLKQDYTLVFLILSLIGIPFFGYYSLIMYLLPFLFKTYKNRKSGLFFYMGYLIARDITVVIGILLFFPSKKLNYKVELINNTTEERSIKTNAQ